MAGDWQMVISGGDPPEVGKSFEAGGSLVTVTKVEWSYVYPDGKRLECSRREIAQACVDAHGGHIAYRPV
jgi:hypothetical protein